MSVSCIGYQVNVIFLLHQFFNDILYHIIIYYIICNILFGYFQKMVINLSGTGEEPAISRETTSNSIASGGSRRMSMKDASARMKAEALRRYTLENSGIIFNLFIIM